MAAKKTKRKRGKPKPKLYVKKKRFAVSPVILVSIVALVIMLGSVLASMRFDAEEPEQELPEAPEPIVPLVPEIQEAKFRSDLEIESLLSNGTYFIRVVDLPTTQLVIDLERMGRREQLQIERINYLSDCPGEKNPSIAQLCPEAQNMLPVVVIFRPEGGHVAFSGPRTMQEIEELMNGTIAPTAYFYQEECDVCPRIFDTFLLSLPGTALFEEIGQEKFLEYGGISYPAFVLSTGDLIFQDYAKNLNLFILENTANTSIRQSGDTLFMASNPSATFNEDCGNSLIHFYTPDCGNCLGYSMCEEFSAEENRTVETTLVGEERRGCDYYEGISQIVARYPEINYQEVCLGDACEYANGEEGSALELAEKYGVQAAPTLVYNCKYREEGFQANQEERIVNYLLALNPDLDIVLG